MAYRLPVIVARGSLDDRCRQHDVQALAGLWRGDAHVIEGAGHAAYVDTPGATAQLIQHVTAAAVTT